MVGNKIADSVAKSYDGIITKNPRNSLQNNSETVTNEHNKEIRKLGYFFLKKRQHIMDELRWIIEKHTIL